jgi:hypothetical protein
MARGLITLKSSGLKEFANELTALADHFDEIVKESQKAAQDVIEDAIRINWTTMVGGQSGGYVFDSIGQSLTMSQYDAHTVIGTVGVYHLDAVDSKHGKTNKDLNAAQIAYWVEFGTSRLKSGARKTKSAEYNEEDLVKIAAVPFISNAGYQTVNEQEKAFSETFNRLADKYR